MLYRTDDIDNNIDYLIGIDDCNFVIINDKYISAIPTGHYNEVFYIVINYV